MGCQYWGVLLDTGMQQSTLAIFPLRPRWRCQRHWSMLVRCGGGSRDSMQQSLLQSAAGVIRLPLLQSVEQAMFY